MTEYVAGLEAEINRLNLLLIRKSQALAVFADPVIWDGHNTYIWNGINEMRNPMSFARRESEATEPDDGPGPDDVEYPRGV